MILSPIETASLHERFAKHELATALKRLADPKEIHALAEMVLRNSTPEIMGGSPTIKKISIPWSSIQFGETSGTWNEVLIEKCQRSPVVFYERMLSSPDEWSIFTHKSNGRFLPFVEEINQDYRVFDGMHRIMGRIFRIWQANHTDSNFNFGKSSANYYSFSQEKKRQFQSPPGILFTIIKAFGYIEDHPKKYSDLESTLRHFLFADPSLGEDMRKFLVTHPHSKFSPIFSSVLNYYQNI